ncbi:SLIT-ROBO Rho GTPase-activating 1 isoform X4 [Pelobates cultripes]|uniref:SLIT-ROBO Rho GTPase-activating 1 isoform X4 n=1 Tax=Pelobates cultripes TaxID=61616 RepID=A0AAD1TDT2_PELCU|nr:SLIT-ROBO Rho GTPase-activating 1 isoform X4 [Pelobates cultripes]
MWKESLESVQRWQGEHLPIEEQRLQARVPMQMPMLGEQPRWELVMQLDSLAQRELWLGDAYQVLRWYAVQCVPGMAKYDRPEGKDYNCPGLSELGNAAESRLWDIHDYREAMLNLPMAEDLEPDLIQLAIREWDLGQEYQYLLSSSPSQYILKESGQIIPLIVESCIRFINLYGLQHQGIFRVSGSQVEVNDIKNAFERGEDPLTDDQNNHDINSVAGVLKLYFRGLENPLFPKERFNDLISCIRNLAVLKNGGADGKAVQQKGVVWLQSCLEDALDTAGPSALPDTHPARRTRLPQHLSPSEQTGGRRRKRRSVESGGVDAAAGGSHMTAANQGCGCAARKCSQERGCREM